MFSIFEMRFERSVKLVSVSANGSSPPIFVTLAPCVPTMKTDSAPSSMARTSAGVTAGGAGWWSGSAAADEPAARRRRRSRRRRQRLGGAPAAAPSAAVPPTDALTDTVRGRRRVVRVFHPAGKPRLAPQPRRRCLRISAIWVSVGTSPSARPNRRAREAHRSGRADRGPGRAGRGLARGRRGGGRAVQRDGWRGGQLAGDRGV